MSTKLLLVSFVSLVVIDAIIIIIKMLTGVPRTLIKELKNEIFLRKLCILFFQS